MCPRLVSLQRILGPAGEAYHRPDPSVSLTSERKSNFNFIMLGSIIQTKNGQGTGSKGGLAAGFEFPAINHG